VAPAILCQRISFVKLGRRRRVERGNSGIVRAIGTPALVKPRTDPMKQSGVRVAAGSRPDRMVVAMATPRDPSTVLEKKEARLKPPPMYEVALLNDDYTPMEFVVGVLQKFFGMGREKATQVMLKVHREGRGVCGIYPKDVATTKVEQVSGYSRQHQHPLQCVMEEA
jgi:ATP-dependent Clp protease adaptor protein ClpS